MGLCWAWRCWSMSGTDRRTRCCHLCGGRLPAVQAISKGSACPLHFPEPSSAHAGPGSVTVRGDLQAWTAWKAWHGRHSHPRQWSLKCQVSSIPSFAVCCVPSLWESEAGCIGTSRLQPVMRKHGAARGTRPGAQWHRAGWRPSSGAADLQSHTWLCHSDVSRGLRDVGRASRSGWQHLGVSYSFWKPQGTWTSPVGPSLAAVAP